MFLHGVLGSHLNWRRIIAHFEGGFHCLAYDQRGHGRSFHATDGYHPRQFAQDLQKILDELGWGRVSLVGHSMGGRNALEFAHLLPTRVETLVIEDIGPEANTSSVQSIERLLSKVPTPFASREQAREFFQNEYPGLIGFHPQPDVISRFLHSNIAEVAPGRWDWRFDRDGILESLQVGRNEDRWDQWRNLKMPVLLVRGAKSTELTDETFQRMQRELPTAEAVEIADSGHWVHADQPEAFMKLLDAFFVKHLGLSL